MQLGMIGLGRMGANMVRRLQRGGHTCVVYDREPAHVAALVQEGAVGAASLDEFAAKLSPPRAAWVMVPAGSPTEETVMALGSRLAPGDTYSVRPRRPHLVTNGGDASATFLVLQGIGEYDFVPFDKQTV